MIVNPEKTMAPPTLWSQDLTADLLSARWDARADEDEGEILLDFYALMDDMCAVKHEWALLEGTELMSSSSSLQPLGAEEAEWAAASAWRSTDPSNAFDHSFAAALADALHERHCPDFPA